VAVTPLRNLTGDLERQRLVEDFTGSVLTDLFQHCRGFSFAWLPREPRWDAKLSPPNPPELISGSVQPINHPLFAQVRALIDKGKTWVKLSGAYADTKVGPPTYADSTAVAQAYAKAAPEGCVWGSDWPRCEPRTPPNKPAQLSAPFRARAGPFLLVRRRRVAPLQSHA